MNSSILPSGCLLVGSVPLKDAEEVFRTCLNEMPGRLRRIPDGETGERHYFCGWQHKAIAKEIPHIQPQLDSHYAFKYRDFSPEQVEKDLASFRSKGFKTGHADAALQSYSDFRRLKAASVIPRDVKFQVSLPTAVNVVAFLERSFQPGFEPIYEKALHTALRTIQDEIPHHELAIQLDLAADTAVWEGVIQWWGKKDVKQAVVGGITRMMDQVDEDVELGFHNCYGDAGHKHFIEPDDLTCPVERAQAVFAQSKHPLKWFHVPIPLSAMDKLESFLAPLKVLLPKFKEDGTELYLGLVHFDDLEGTKKRIETARKVLGDTDFGITTECGLGRTPVQQIKNIFSISRELSNPVH